MSDGYSYGSSRSAVLDPPHLTPQFCFSTSALKDFLRLSRSTIDDSITQHLNALHTPSRNPFPPTTNSGSSSTTSSYPTPTSRLQRPLPAPTCRTFTTAILFPSWQSRSDVLNYCASVATSSDPDDPDSLTRLAETEERREKVVDERLDPYSARWFPRESRTEVLAGVVRLERGVEEIVRERSWRVVGERCGGWEAVGGREWRAALERWRKEKGEGRGGAV